MRTAPPHLLSPVRPDNRPPTRNDSARARHERRTRCAYRATAALCATLLPIAAVVGASLENASAVTRVAVAWAIASLAAVAVCAYATAAGAQSRAPRPVRLPHSGRVGKEHSRWAAPRP